MTRKLFRTALLAWALLLAAPYGEARAQEIPMTLLGPGTARDVNAWGRISGTDKSTWNAWVAALWDLDGAVRILGAFGYESHAMASNDLDLTVGASSHSPNSVYPFRATAWIGEEMIDLGAPGGTDSRANAVNDAGQIVGEVEGTDLGGATLWTLEPGGQISAFSLGTVGGEGLSGAIDINDRGEVAGWSHVRVGEGQDNFAQHAVLWTAERGMEDLGTLPGGLWSIASAINGLGHVVGVSTTALDGYPKWHAFLWTRETGMIDLELSAGASPNGGAEPTGINDRDEIVGYRYPAGDPRAFFWSHERGWVDLPSPGISRAYDINDDGTVVGEAVIRGAGMAVAWHVRPQVTAQPDPTTAHPETPGGSGGCSGAGGGGAMAILALLAAAGVRRRARP